MRTIIFLLLSFLAATPSFSQTWRLSGNAAVAANQFLGTTDNVDLRIRTNNLQRMVILGANGRVGIGTAAPAHAFHVTTATETRGGYFQNTNPAFSTFGLYAETSNPTPAAVEKAGQLMALGASGYNYGLWSEAANGAVNYGAYTRGNSVAGTSAYGIYSQVSGAGDNFAGYFTGGRVYVSHRLGITDETPDYALDFGASYGDKVSLYTTPNHLQNWHYGLGVQPGLLQIHTDALTSDIAFGIGRSGQFTEKMRIKGTGRVGINETAPAATLHVKGPVGEYPLLVRTGDNVTRFKVNPNGSVSIGTTGEAPNSNSLVVGDQVLINTTQGPNGYLLAVNGKAILEEVTVQLSQDWPDYVFGENYPLRPLPELEKFVRENQHLPGIPTAAAVQKNGLDLGDINRRLTEKVEELTLYIIALEKRLQALEERL
jgi:hypothetical protein